MADDPRRQVPSVRSVLELPAVVALVDAYGQQAVVAAVRDSLDHVRTRLSTSEGVPAHDLITDQVLARLQANDRGRVQPVINATGVVLHTNLGRAPLSQDAIAAMVAAAGACTVEYDLERRQRASRGEHAHRLLRDLIGAEDALVVNNGAAALVLALAVVASGRRVAVSRGELVEIGGSFRLPAIIEAAGVGLTEVGTTNRTRTDDYLTAARADPDIATFLRVHTSNFRIEGFTHCPTAAELATAARQQGVPFLHDVGSGVLHDDLPLPVAPALEPTMAAAIADGADLVIASGDKLLGGPQAGLLGGSRELVQRCRRHPLARALRIDKLRLAALEATLETYRRDRHADLPIWTMIQVGVDDLRKRARPVHEAATTAGLTAEIIEVDAVIGGGSMPGATIPSIAIAIADPHGTLAAQLAANQPPIITRTQDGRLLLDLRTVNLEHDHQIASSLRDPPVDAPR